MDVEKTIEFILEQSAATDGRIAANAAQIQELTADVADLKEVTRHHTADLDLHIEWMTGMSHALQDLASQMKEGFDKVAVKHAELADMQKTTQENLNILIRTVQDIIPRLPK